MRTSCYGNVYTVFCSLSQATISITKRRSRTSHFFFLLPSGHIDVIWYDDSVLVLHECFHVTSNHSCATGAEYITVLVKQLHNSDHIGLQRIFNILSQLAPDIRIIRSENIYPTNIFGKLIVFHWISPLEMFNSYLCLIMILVFANNVKS